MPELPDVTVYVEALTERLAGHTLERVLIRSPFLLRSTSPPVPAAHGKVVREVRRLGKRIAIGLEENLWIVLHLMIAGRLHWRPTSAKPPAKNALAVLQFDNGSIVFTEAGTQHRASLQMASGEEGLAALSAGGLEVMEADLASFRRALTSANHTLKRALTDPHLFSGIGNAYSDEILHRAQLSPVAMTLKLTGGEIERLYQSTREILTEWSTACGPKPPGIPRKGHRVPRGDGRPRPLRPALSPLRREGPAHPLRIERDELLRSLPDRRQTSRRPRPLAPAASGLAALPRRNGGTQEALILSDKSSERF